MITAESGRRIITVVGVGVDHGVEVLRGEGSHPRCRLELLMLDQTVCRFHNRIAYDRHFGGMALDIAYSGVVTPTEMKMSADVAGMALEFVVKKEK